MGDFRRTGDLINRWFLWLAFLFLSGPSVLLSRKNVREGRGRGLGVPNEFNPGCFEGSLESPATSTLCLAVRRGSVPDAAASGGSPREFRKFVRRPSKSGSGTSNLDTRQH